MKRRYVLAMPTLAALLAACSSTAPAGSDKPLDTTKPTIAATIASNPDLTTLAGLLKASGVDETLKGPGPFTLFAPTNAAFAKLSAADLASLKDPAKKAKLMDVLKYHISPKNYTTTELKSAVRIPSLEGQDIEIDVKPGGLQAGNDEAPPANLIKPDIAASNGTIHIIDAIFVPE